MRRLKTGLDRVRRSSQFNQSRTGLTLGHGSNPARGNAEPKTAFTQSAEAAVASLWRALSVYLCKTVELAAIRQLPDGVGFSPYPTPRLFHKFDLNRIGYKTSLIRLP
jgi:hypothetical protein